MHKNNLITIKAIAITILLCCLPSIWASNVELSNGKEDREVIFFVHGQYAPLIYSDEQGNSVGYFYELLQEIFTTRLGIDVKAKGLPWTRAQQLVKDGLADLLLTVPAVNIILDGMIQNGELKRLLKKYQSLDFIKTIKAKRPRSD